MTPTDLPALLARIPTLPRQELEVLYPLLAACHAACQARLLMPQAAPPSPHADELLSPQAVAALLNVSRDWVYKHADRLGGKVVVGGRVRFSKRALEAALSSLVQP